MVRAVNRLTTEEVKAEVTRFWNVFTSKAPERLEEFYAPDATVFASSTVRAEPGRLAVARRRREYFHAQTSVHVNVGLVEVQMVADNIAVVSYTFKFHASKVVSALGKMNDEDIQNGRATQIFVQDAEGALKIVHEHLSTVAAGEATH